MLKLKQTVVYKKDRAGTGLLFSVGDDSNQLVKLSGIIDEIVRQMSEGKDFHSVIAQILQDYDVDESQLMQDLNAFSTKLSELGFLDE